MNEPVCSIAQSPNDLAKFFVQRANAGDAEGLTDLYEEDAVLEFMPDELAVGSAQISAAYQRMVVAKPVFELGVQAPILQAGDIALTPQPVFPAAD